MRAWIVVAMLGAALAAQTPTQSDQSKKDEKPAAAQADKPPAETPPAEKPKPAPPLPDYSQLLRRMPTMSSPGTAVVAAPRNQPCAIPLKNVLRRDQGVSRMPQVRPPKAGFPIKEVPLPAPSCEDVK